MHTPTAPQAAAQLWLEAGLAYDAKRSEESAIEALRRVLALEPDAAAEQLATGLLTQIMLRRGERPAGDARWDCGRRREAIDCGVRPP